MAIQNWNNVMIINSFLIAVLSFFFYFICFDIFAADHEDGPSVVDNPQADILDFFAFPSADGERLVLAMTLFSNAEDNATFGTDFSYRFRLRKGKVLAEGLGLKRRVKLSAVIEEDVIACSALKLVEGEEKMACAFNRASCGDQCLASEVPLGVIAPKNPDGFRIFAGLVHDPFFSGVFRVRENRPSASGMIFNLLDSIQPDINPFEKRSALALVVEVPIKNLKFKRGVLAAVAETHLFRNQQVGRAHQVDRMGNVEVTNFLLCFRPIKVLGIQIGFNQIEFSCPQEREIIKDSYNSDDAFNVHADHKSLYEKWFGIGLKVLDRIDSDTDNGKTEKLDWPHADPVDGIKHPFQDLFVNSDWLMVDTDKVCPTEKGVFTYFDIEMSAYFTGAGSHQTCGGRTPNEDVIDKILTLFINGPDRLPGGWWGSQSQGTIRTDGVDQAHSVAPSEFPWLSVR